MSETWKAGKRQIEGRKSITDPLPQGLLGSGHSSLFACAHSATPLSSYNPFSDGCTVTVLGLLEG